MTPAEKLRKSKRVNYHPGICRVLEDGSPRRGWMFCEAWDCVEVIRKRNGPRCQAHGSCPETPEPAKMRATMSKCSFPGCDRDAFAAELCVGHYQQKHREPRRALRPLRPINQVRLGSVRVSEECAAALEAKGPNKAAAAKAVLEEWAKTWRGR